MAVEYKIVSMTRQSGLKKDGFPGVEMEKHFNDMASQGYSFVRYIPDLSGGSTFQLHFIFEKKDD